MRCAGIDSPRHCLYVLAHELPLRSEQATLVV
jgi:hypothetical protein